MLLLLPCCSSLAIHRMDRSGILGLREQGHDATLKHYAPTLVL
jgi:hypothetical protein